MENDQPEEQLSKKMRKERKQQEKLEAKKSAVKKLRTKKLIQWIGWVVFGGAIVAGIVWLAVSQPKTPDSEIVSRNGLHWHPKMDIYVKGEKQEFPSNIGIGAVHQPVHTHEDAKEGVVHLELEGMVRKSDITVGQFFKSWGKDIQSLGANVKMTVNGKENTELENYQMNEKDQIELRYD